jgi:glyoxylase-like metal-dependent hydrolase (beta-lactamase superfamily II)
VSVGLGGISTPSFDGDGDGEDHGTPAVGSHPRARKFSIPGVIGKDRATTTGHRWEALMRALPINDETTMFTSAVPIPTIGNLAVNSFLIRGEQPTLIDTGITPEAPEFDVALRELIDPVDLRWIIVTHADRDHVGSLARLLAEAPNATVVTAFITFGVMSVGSEPIPPERAFLVRDGSTLDLGDRTLRATRPPFFDNPGTLAFHDPKQNILFSSDCFGAPFATPEEALAEDVGTIAPDVLAPAQMLWGSVDSPWVHFVDEARLAENLQRFVQDRPDTVLSTHLPPIRGDLDRHVETLAKVPSSPPVVTADQAELEAFMASMAPH